MKKVILLLLMAATALAATAQRPYDWNRLDTLIGEAQYATAYPLAQQYYRQSLATDNGPEVLTAAFYLTTLDYAYSKDANDSAIMRYNYLVRQLKGVDRAVAYTFLFDTYNSLYSKNYWRIERNKPSNDPNRKYTLWDCQRMQDSLMRYADSVLAYCDQLRTTDIKRYARLFQTDTTAPPPLDSTLLGMLVQTLLTNNYIRINPSDIDILSGTGTLQWLLRPLPLLHEQSSSPHARYSSTAPYPLYELAYGSTLPYPLPLHLRMALLYAFAPADMTLWLDLKRYDQLHFDSSFVPALDSLTAYYQSRPTSNEMKALLGWQRARYLDKDRQKVLAEQVCLETEKAYPNTYGARSCRVLRQYDICLPEFKIHYNNIESSQRSRLAHVEARNIPLLHFRIIGNIELPHRLTEQWRDTLMTLTPVKAWQQALPDADDHLWHEYLVALPPMPQGDYYLLAYSDSNSVEYICYSEYISSDATFITYTTPATTGRRTQLMSSSGHLVDRVSGQPMAGKRVTLHGMGEMTDLIYHRRCRTDKQGFFHFPTSSPTYGFIDYDELSAQVDGYEYFFEESGYVETFLTDREPTKFLNIVMHDRPVYRLGDTVRFCCVAYRRHLKGKEQRQHVRPAKHVKLIATFGKSYGDNYDTLRLTTDEHGRCWGEFVIPTTGENGQYRLSVKSPNYDNSFFDGYYTYQQIKVEAYKPPHFMVTLSRYKEDNTATTHAPNRFGQPITLYGSAISYSGAPMTGAKVKWEVSSEEMLFPLYANTLANDFPYSDSLTVDSNGLFQFTFTPEKTSNTSSFSSTSKTRETRIFTAYARVIDADGELHEQHLSFHVSEADGYCLLTSDDLGHLTFAYNNFDNQPLDGSVQVELYQLRQPDTIRTLDTLMKQYPDAQWIGSKAEFQRLFPYRAFSREEGDRHSWPVVAKRFSTTTTERTLTIPNLPSGLYRVVFHTPDSNQLDTLVNYVAPGGRVTGDDVVWLRTTPKKNWTYFNSLTCSVGDTVRIELGSPYGNQPLFYRVAHNAKIYQRGMMVLDSSHTSTLLIPITKRMTDGCVLQLSAVREGRTFATMYNIQVSQPERLLNISTETFRDRLQPGEQERWTFRITSPLERGGRRPGYVTDSLSQGIKANLCLGLYDLSLDQYNRLQRGFWPWGYPDRGYPAAIPHPKTISRKSVNNSYIGLSANNSPRLGFSLLSRIEYRNQLLRLFGEGTLRGTVVDAKTQEPLPFVNVMVKVKGHLVKGTTTDFDGNFIFRNLPPGECEITFSYVGYHKYTRFVTIDSDNITTWTVPLQQSSTPLQEVVIMESKTPLHGDNRPPIIEIGAPETGMRMSAGDIAHMPGSSVESIVAAVGGVGLACVVTLQGGVRKRTGVNVPKSAIAEITPMFNFDGQTSEGSAQLRKNLSTLAFFEPALRSGKDGLVSVSFTLPDALTQWQLNGFAWTDQFQVGTLSRTIQSQKELMVQPLMPRFLRQGDTIEIRAKVSNLTDSAMTVRVGIEIENGELKIENYPGAAALNVIGDTPAQFSTLNSQLTLSPHNSAIASTRLAVGSDWRSADYKVFATANRHSDGEQGRLPVLSNRERITTSHLIYVPGSMDGKEVVRTFDISLPAPAPSDSTTLSFTANPIRYAIEALPHFKRHRMPGNIYLANSIYVNHLTTLIDTITPKEKQRIASRAKSDLHRLLNAQHSTGGWSWMPGGREPSRYVTETVLQRLAKCPSLDNDPFYHRQYLQAVNYLDKKLVEKYDALLHSSHLPWKDDCLSLIYTRSLYLDTKPLNECDSTTQTAYRFYYDIIKAHANEITALHTQGQLALLILHMGDTADAVRLANRIKGSAHTADDLGMYWNNNTSGYGWYQRPIETAALMVDVFADVLHDWESVSRIQQWILASKQGTIWRTDMATAHALAALFHQPANTTLRQGTVTIKCNNQEIESGTIDVEKYTNSSTNFQFSIFNSQLFPAWGAIFHSHDTPIDSIPYNGTGMKLRKTLSRVNDDGSLTLLTPESTLRVGDRVRVHIDIDIDRIDLSNLVLRDQRAAAFEPVSTTSGWQWNDGLRYYVDVRDEWTDCYIDYLYASHYYVEYDLWVRHSGIFANGIATLQSVYAPEFRANTDSQTILVP